MTALMEAVRTLAPFSGANLLWTQNDVCTYLAIDKTKLRSIIARPDFPRAIRLPSDKGTGHPRYRSDEVVDWTGKWQEKN